MLVYFIRARHIGMYRIISSIGAAPIKAPPKAYPIFSVPIVSALGHWKQYQAVPKLLERNMLFCTIPHVLNVRQRNGGPDGIL